MGITLNSTKDIYNDYKGRLLGKVKGKGYRVSNPTPYLTPDSTPNVLLCWSGIYG